MDQITILAAQVLFLKMEVAMENHQNTTAMAMDTTELLILGGNNVVVGMGLNANQSKLVSITNSGHPETTQTHFFIHFWVLEP